LGCGGALKKSIIMMGKPLILELLISEQQLYAEDFRKMKRFPIVELYFPDVKNQPENKHGIFPVKFLPKKGEKKCHATVDITLNWREPGHY
jgi:hypothetical protein